MCDRGIELTCEVWWVSYNIIVAINELFASCSTMQPFKSSGSLKPNITKKIKIKVPILNILYKLLYSVLFRSHRDLMYEDNISSSRIKVQERFCIVFTTRTVIVLQ